MALIKCPECNAQISDRAISCVNCGYPISQHPTSTITTRKTIEDLFGLSDSELGHYKLHLARRAIGNFNDLPLDAYLRGWKSWEGWNRWRGTGHKNDFTRDYIFTLIRLYNRYYHNPDEWLFGGIFRVVKRFDNWNYTQIGYDVKLVDLRKDLIGRLIVNFHCSQGMLMRAYNLETYYKHLTVCEILEKTLGGIIPV